MKRLLFLICMAVLIVGLSTLADASSTGKKTDPAAVAEDARILTLTPEEYEARTETQIECVRAYWLLIDKMGYDENNRIKLDIDEQGAIAAGASREGYRELLRSFEESNNYLDKVEAEIGKENIELLDFAKLSERYHAYLDGKMTLEEFRKGDVNLKVH